MKYFLLLFFTIFFIQITLSQDKVMDSIKIRKESYKKRDSIRVKNLIQYTKYTQLHNEEETEDVIKEALSISKEINYIEGSADAFSAYALYHNRTGNFKKALVYAKKAKYIQDSIKDIKGLIITNVAIANVYIELNQQEKGIEILKENLNLLNNKNPQKAAMHFYLARSYQSLNKFKKAEFHYNEAKKIAILSNFTTGVSIANSSIGTVKIKNKEYKKGIEYIEKALVFFKKTKQQANIAHSYNQMAIGFSKLNKVDKAINYNDKAIAIYKKQKNLKNLTTIYLHQSDCFMLKKDYEKSNFYLKESYKIKDSLFSMANVKNINEMQTKYNTEKITLEKKIALEKNKKNKTLLYSTLTIFSLLLLSSLFYFKSYKTKKKAELVLTKLEETKKRLVVEKQYRTSELKALKAQMNPHFIFNSLNSIQGLILQQDTNASYDYIVLFANLVRNTLNYSDKDFIPIQDELEFLDVYLKLEKLRFGNDFTYSIDYNGTKETNIPPLIIQPFLENALLHGLLHKEGNKELNITFEFSEQLKCTIIDNGIGRTKAKKIQERQGKTHESFAIKSIEKRLEILTKKSGVKTYFTITDLYDYDIPRGTKVEIVLPHKMVF